MLLCPGRFNLRCGGLTSPVKEDRKESAACLRCRRVYADLDRRPWENGQILSIHLGSQSVLYEFLLLAVETFLRGVVLAPKNLRASARFPDKRSDRAFSLQVDVSGRLCPLQKTQ